jgi:hypothetical protein
MMKHKRLYAALGLLLALAATADPQHLRFDAGHGLPPDNVEKLAGGFEGLHDERPAGFAGPTTPTATPTLPCAFRRDAAL